MSDKKGHGSKEGDGNAGSGGGETEVREGDQPAEMGLDKYNGDELNPEHHRLSHTEIDRIQRENTYEIEKEVETCPTDALSEEEKKKAAASTIQSRFRQYREHRPSAGNTLSPSQRWTEAIKTAKYQHMANPRADMTDGKSKWNRAAFVAGKLNEDGSSSSDEEVEVNEEKAKQKRKLKEDFRKQKLDDAKILTPMHWLELVDLKHRYGSNLGTYHRHWQTCDTKQNFFMWLDHGEGREVSLPACPRDQLDSEQVRYLSREERMKYLVKVDENGLLVWHRNGEKVHTTTGYKDSIEGIVRQDADVGLPENFDAHSGEDSDSGESTSSSSSSSSSSSALSSTERADRYVNPGGKLSQFKATPGALFNRLLRKTTRKNTWIFVADSSFHLYVGIKQSGAFQHSSFLHGARVAAAGLIKVRDGQLKSLSPLSGHYRCTSQHFRRFVKSLRSENVDMSHVSISKSYALLMGIEAWGKVTKGKKQLGIKKKKFAKTLEHPVDDTKRRISQGLDNLSKEEKKEVKDEEKQRTDNAIALKLMKKFSINPGQGNSDEVELRASKVPKTLKLNGKTNGGDASAEPAGAKT